MEDNNKRSIDTTSQEIDNGNNKKVKIDDQQIEESNDNSNNEISISSVEDSSSLEASTTTEVTENKNIVEDSTATTETNNEENETNDNQEEQTEFKIKIEKLPQYINIPDLRKIFQKYELRFWKCKTNLKWDFAFASFKSEEERQDAIKKLNGLKIKTSNIVVIPINDNKEKKFEKRPSNISRKGKVKEPEPEDTRTPSEKLMDQVTPFW
eukprot:jgi/Orpsp1_1/1190667/evm.model.d7180000080394.1